MTQLKLLILDDDELTGETIHNVAFFAGMDVRFCQDPKEFFQVLQQWKPTHLAIDLIMPQMDGIEVMVELANRNCNAQIIITSGVGSRVLEAAARSASAHGLDILGILAKPFSPKMFRELLTQAPKLSDANTPKAASTSTTISIEIMQQALADHEFTVAFQPKVDCRNGHLKGFEALARWNSSQLGQIKPDLFIYFAEQNRLIDELTEQVMQIALRSFSQFLNGYETIQIGENRSNLTLSINISALSLGNLELFDKLEQWCHDIGIEHEQLLLEVTETGAMEDSVASLDILTRLRMKGFQLSIDDFGTGFSSMLQLVRLPFSELKVDQTFVMTALKSRESRVVIKAIIDLAHSLGLTVTAEGIEDSDTLVFLQNLGCDLAQGYYIAKPMNAEQIIPWLTDRQLAKEKQRLISLYALNILDTPEEPRFDRIATLAQSLFCVPIGLISLVDDSRQWFKSHQGLDCSETVRSIAFCSRAIEQDDVYIVPNAELDPNFSANPLVIGEPYIRFYAGSPIKASSGEKLGTLCIIDQVPRVLDGQQISLLRFLSVLVELELSSKAQSLVDSQTGLMKRAGFESRAERLLQLNEHFNIPVSLLYIQLMDLKHINSTYGASVGGDNISDFATLLTFSFTDAYLIARISDEEFVVLFVNIDAELVSKALLLFDTQLFAHNTARIGKHRLRYGSSLITVPPGCSSSLQSLYSQADSQFQRKTKVSTDKNGWF
jgi:diguanylate cyclase (GGDEF)-like protein